nr:MAG: ORF1 [Torque teno midi virus]
MPFWWRRRRKFWWGKSRPRWRFQRYKRRTRRRRRRAPRRRAHKYARRRRRRRTKVRRKKPKIPLYQWQPDKIVKCKIKGVTTLVLGAEGKQLVCYTNVKQANTPPKAPGGGGFGCEQFSLDSLYSDYKLRKNVWTKSNIFLDLCRYLCVKCTFYRHPETDFIIAYHRQPPFDISKEIYAACHPQNMLLARHKMILLSKFSNPKGRIKKTKLIKPPKQMLNKWFFQEHFSHEPLLMIQATAANLNYSNLGCCNTNQMCTFFYINPGFYQLANWGATTTTGYVPYTTFPQQGVYTWNYKQWSEQKGGQAFTKPTSYNSSVNYETGFFCKQLLEAVQLTTTESTQTKLGMNPVNICRYNPTLDTGKGNAIWLVSSHSNTYKKPDRDKTLIFEGLPLYMLLYGYLSYVQKVKNVKDFLQNYTLCMQSPALFPYAQPGAEMQTIIPVNENFIHGKAAYDETLTTTMKGYWTPNVYQQIQTLNTMVESGPYIPKYSQTKNSTWELDMFYTFYFKWGGPEQTDPPITDPALQGTYEVPDKLQQAVQIRDPGKIKAASILHPWDIRKGYFTTPALKRMSDNLSIDTTFQPDTEIIPTKRRRTGPELSTPQQEQEEIQACLQELFKKSTFQEETEEDIHKLIQQQHQQQQDLKWNILRVISEIKQSQNLLKLQTGFPS